jgi:pimeloyl-ACP methyl ester carboxylesterase
MTDSPGSHDRTVTEYEVQDVATANATGKQPVVFVHGLWLLPNSWDRWRKVFEEAGYATAAPGWPDDPETTEEAKAHPEVFANKSIGQIADHYQEVIEALDKKPAIIGHSFGGLLTEILAGRGLAAVSVPISPAPFRGVLPLPFSALKSGSPVLRNPANRGRAVPLTYDQFKYGFANMLDEDEAQKLYEEYSVAGSGKVLFQAASANLNPWTEDKVDTENPERGPMLILAGEKDHTVPHAIANASFKRERRNNGVTEIVEIEGRGHSLTIDNGWREVCDKALEFVKRFV